MALSARRADLQSWRDFLQYAKANGVDIKECKPYSSVNTSLHKRGSWHGDTAVIGGVTHTLAADLNYGKPGASPEEKAMMVRKIIPSAASYGIAVLFDASGRGVGVAINHRDHAHVDVGSYSNYGNGEFVQPRGNRRVRRVQNVLHQPMAKRDNLLSVNGFTHTDLKVLRAASKIGGVKFPEGKYRAQRVVGIPSKSRDGIWGADSKSRHNKTVYALKVALKDMGYFAGTVNSTWDTSLDYAVSKFIKANS